MASHWWTWGKQPVNSIQFRGVLETMPDNRKLLLSTALFKSFILQAPPWSTQSKSYLESYASSWGLYKIIQEKGNACIIKQLKTSPLPTGVHVSCCQALRTPSLILFSLSLKESMSTGRQWVLCVRFEFPPNVSVLVLISLIHRRMSSFSETWISSKCFWCRFWYHSIGEWVLCARLDFLQVFWCWFWYQSIGEWVFCVRLQFPPNVSVLVLISLRPSENEFFLRDLDFLQVFWCWFW